MRENKQPEAVAEANLSLAEVHFKRRNFEGAKKYYTAVLATSQSGSKGLAAYRLAWCEFNTGKLEESIAGLKKILVTPELSSRSASAACHSGGSSVPRRGVARFGDVLGAKIGDGH